jgi:hypothetical protein
VLDAKGGENKVKARNGSATTWEFWKSRVRIFVCQKNLNCLFCQKLVSYGEKAWLWEKGGVFESLINFSWNISLYVSTSVFDLEIGNWVWFAKNKPSGGKEWSIYAKFESKQFWFCIDVALPLVAFYCVGINHQKGGDWKGNVPLGQF